MLAICWTSAWALCSCHMARNAVCNSAALQLIGEHRTVLPAISSSAGLAGCHFLRASALSKLNWGKLVTGLVWDMTACLCPLRAETHRVPSCDTGLRRLYGVAVRERAGICQLHPLLWLARACMATVWLPRRPGPLPGHRHARRGRLSAGPAAALHTAGLALAAHCAVRCSLEPYTLGSMPWRWLFLLCRSSEGWLQASMMAVSETGINAS